MQPTTDNATVNESMFQPKTTAGPQVSSQLSASTQPQPSQHWCKDFKISGQIGEPGQRERLMFSSLAHQIENGLNRGHTEIEIVDAVIRAISPGLQLRSYLEGKPQLSLPTLRRILCERHGAVQAASFRSTAEQRDPSKLPNTSFRPKTESSICVARVGIRA